jgi:hypothetical protein
LIDTSALVNISEKNEHILRADKGVGTTYWTQALRKKVIIVAVYLLTFIEEILE